MVDHIRRINGSQIVTMPLNTQKADLLENSKIILKDTVDKR